MKPLVVIPARGGSKGVPGKNIKLLGGKPLIHYTIEAAQEIFDDEIICISTDNVNIKACAEKTGIKVPFIRPSELATDTSGTYEVLLHALNHYESKGYVSDTVILLQPTSPFRKPLHIKEALDLYNPTVDMVVSVKETKANPYYVLFEEDQHRYLRNSKNANFSHRQECPKVWELNGAIYIINVESLKKKTMSSFDRKIKYIMDEISSHDIDSIYDWKIAEFLITRK